MKAYGLTILRVTVGALYLLHAYRLLVVTTPAGTAGFITRAFGLPHPTLLAYIVIAGMLEYTFIYDHTRGSLLAVMTLMLVTFTLNVPILLAFTVARFQAVGPADAAVDS